MGRMINCWEFTDCGREPGGSKVSELGLCPAAVDASSHGLNHGINGGRICWAVAGNFADRPIAGTFARENLLCTACDFFRFVQEEEGIERLTVLKPDQLLYHIP